MLRRTIVTIGPHDYYGNHPSFARLLTDTSPGSAAISEGMIVMRHWGVDTNKCWFRCDAEPELWRLSEAFCGMGIK